MLTDLCGFLAFILVPVGAMALFSGSLILGAILLLVGICCSLCVPQDQRGALIFSPAKTSVWRFLFFLQKILKFFGKFGILFLDF